MELNLFFSATGNVDNCKLALIHKLMFRWDLFCCWPLLIIRHKGRSSTWKLVHASEESYFTVAVVEHKLAVMLTQIWSCSEVWAQNHISKLTHPSCCLNLSSVSFAEALSLMLLFYLIFSVSKVVAQFTVKAATNHITSIRWIAASYEDGSDNDSDSDHWNWMQMSWQQLRRWSVCCHGGSCRSSCMCSSKRM